MRFKSPLLFFFLFLVPCLSFSEEHNRTTPVQSSYANETQEARTCKTPMICLTMIVKNESAIIERCLDSVLPVIDCLSICDTGSTDNTVELIEAYMHKYHLPGKVHRHEWKNFGHNRTASAQAAAETLKELGFPVERSYLLLIDADMILEVHPQFNKRALVADCYALTQENGDLAYKNDRLLKASLPWRCIGVTHEYWDSPRVQTRWPLDSLSIDDQDDGGCKSDKFERDLILLTQGLIDEPNNPRYMFYLAQTYLCLGQYENSNDWYQRRVDAGGWEEEVWYSKYMIGQNYESMGKWDEALKAHFDAFNFHPTRAEPLYNIAKYYREREQFSLAVLFAKMGRSIPYPKRESLFISRSIYSYGFDEELSIAAYYTPLREEGWEAANRLVLNPEAPEEIKDFCYNNMLFYIKPLPIERITPLSINLPFVEDKIPSVKYLLSTPSILPTENGYLANCRTVNYKIGEQNEYIPLSKDGIVRTKNYLVHFDKHFRPISQKEVVENFPRPLKPEKRKVTGLEDIRLFRWNNKLWFTCNTLDTSEEQVSQVTLGSIKDPIHGNDRVEVDALRPISGPLNTYCEKNWLPFLKDGSLHFIYSCEPFTIYSLNSIEDHLNEKFCYELPIDCSNFRGSAPPIPYDNGYLFLIHEGIFDNKRTYFHRFMFLDQDLQLTKMSKPFYFKNLGVEYCLSIAIDHSGKKLILPFSHQDREANVGWLDLEVLKTLLVPCKD